MIVRTVKVPKINNLFPIGRKYIQAFKEGRFNSVFKFRNEVNNGRYTIIVRNNENKITDIKNEI